MIGPTAPWLTCVDADDENKNRCRIRKKSADATTCLSLIDASLGSDAICYCGAVTAFTSDQGHPAPASASAGRDTTSESDLALQVTVVSIIATVAVILVALGAKRRAQTATAAHTVAAVHESEAAAGMALGDVLTESTASSASSPSSPSIEVELAEATVELDWDDQL